jgi:hypothetical protein
MKFDVIGRINNMRLPDGKTAILYSVYEAVSNSIHAINDRFSEANAATKGKVHVDIAVNEHGDIDSISITDNGIGFTPGNIVPSGACRTARCSLHWCRRGPSRLHPVIPGSAAQAESGIPAHDRGGAPKGERSRLSGRGCACASRRGNRWCAVRRSASLFGEQRHLGEQRHGLPSVRGKPS